MIHFDDYNLQLIEREIRHCYIRENYKQVECLLRVRKEMLNAQFMTDSHFPGSRIRVGLFLCPSLKKSPYLLCMSFFFHNFAASFIL